MRLLRTLEFAIHADFDDGLVAPGRGRSIASVPQQRSRIHYISIRVICIPFRMGIAGQHVQTRRF